LPHSPLLNHSERVYIEKNPGSDPSIFVLKFFCSLCPVNIAPLSSTEPFRKDTYREKFRVLPGIFVQKFFCSLCPVNIAPLSSTVPLRKDTYREKSRV
jgi:hypothetical protein